MTIQHSAITDPNIHEPKGITSAVVGTVYKADGAGSGSWALPTVSQRFVLSARIDDVSTASSVYIPVPVDCTIVGAVTCLQAAITTANSSITFFRNTDSLGSAMTVAFSSSAAGDTDTFTATTNTAATAGQYIRVVTDGGSSGTAPLLISILCSRTASA